MVTVSISNYSIKIVLIDIGITSDIVFAKAFDQLKVFRERLRPFATPLVGFNRYNTKPNRMMELLVLMGTYPQHASTLVNFEVKIGRAHV